jgi:tetratricopeptide (TPR) repeat protein
MTTYTLREIQAMLGISRSAITGLMAAGFVSPSRGPRGEYRFTFQDVVMLRTAHSLRAANIPSRRILRSLRRLRETLPAELPLSGLRITAAGNEIAVRSGNAQWDADSGQLLLDFELRPAGGAVGIHEKSAGAKVAPDREDAGGRSAEHWFAEGSRLEQKDPRAAEAAYRNAIAAAPGSADAYLNLGCLLCDAGRCDEAAKLYRVALTHAPGEHLLHFNLAIALEDQRQYEDALASYEKCLELAPDFSDAHYNAALLCEQLGRANKAIKHFSAARRLEKR